VTVVSLFGHLPPALIAALIASLVIPAVSQLLTKRPTSWVTGVLTLALSAADGFFSLWASQGDGFNWKSAVGATLVAWGIAALSHSKVIKRTDIERWLVTHGNRGSYDLAG
jgi:hypothetical protein